jgi:cellular nucleic acid-binding protein
MFSSIARSICTNSSLSRYFSLSTALKNELFGGICHRCNQPGHMAKDCPKKKKCYACGSEDHLSANCPNRIKIIPSRTTNQLNRIVCHRCDQPGHLAKDCPEKKKCYTCGSEDHLSANCPNQSTKPHQTNKRTAVCFRCNQPGHTTIDCPEKKKCFRCGSDDHLSAQCPNQRTKSPTTTSHQTDNITSSRKDDRISLPTNNHVTVCKRCNQPGHEAWACLEPLRCFRCGQVGHIAANCLKDDNVSYEL